MAIGQIHPSDAFPQAVRTRANPAVKSTPDSKLIVKDEPCGYIKTVEYINFLPFEVVITEKNGLCYKTDVSRQLGNGNFIIRNTYVIKTEAISKLAAYFNSVDIQDKTSELYRLRELFYSKGGHVGALMPDMEIVVDITVEKFDIINNTNGVYVQDADICIKATNDTKNAAPHPYSKGYLNSDTIAGFDKTGITTSIEIVDNEQSISKRFIVINKNLFEITPIRDNLRPTGCYFTLTHNNQGNKKVEAKTFPLSEMHLLGIYPTKEEALTHGDTETLKKEELARANHELALLTAKLKEAEINANLNLTKAKEKANQEESLAKRLRIKLDKVKAKFEKKGFKRKDKYDESSSKRKDEYDSRARERDDRYESRAARRNDFSSMVKSVPMIAGAVGAVAGLLAGASAIAAVGIGAAVAVGAAIVGWLF